MQHITVDEVGSALAEGKEVILLDVRTPAEYAAGHIEGSVHVELNRLKHDIEGAIPEKSRTMYVYCLSGSRSDLAVPLLERLGYSDVYSVTSGLLAWRAKGLPLIKIPSES
ncbi:MAG: hypothetical protein RLZZ455_101 [Candidatus Parcubacteria bacterium]|jgi:rhodanese-related sulfurtransferase